MTAFCRQLFYCALALAEICSLAHGQVLPAPTAIQDLSSWAQAGLPIAAEWNVNGFPLSWHVAQVRAGHRLLPSIFLPLIDIDPPGTATSPTEIDKRITQFAPDLAYIQANRLPLCLRTNNICNSLGKSPRYRAPLVPASIPPSPLVWRIYNGALDDTPICDSLGPAANWTNEGKVWSITPYMAALQARVTAPPYVVFVENNEWPYETGPYYTSTKDPRTGTTTYKFRTPDEIAALSVRMRDHVAQLSATQTSPKALNTEIALHRRDHYLALYSAFDANLSAGWKGKLYTAAYKAGVNRQLPDGSLPVDQVGYAPQALCYDAPSPPIYFDKNPSDFTSPSNLNILNEIPGWDWREARNPKSYREFLLHLNGVGALAGAIAQRHEAISPARYEGFVQWLLWSMHEPGTPVILRHWCGAATMPTSPFFSLSQFASLDSLGAGALKNLRMEDYVAPILSSVDRVCTNSTLRKFWLQGQPVIVPGTMPSDLALKNLGEPPFLRQGDADRRYRLLDCNLNQPASQWTWDANAKSMRGTIKVWAVATQIGNQALIFAWSPCKLTGSVTLTIPNFGTATIIAPQPWGYWLMTKGGAATPLATN
jgi:hypothetical protein